MYLRFVTPRIDGRSGAPQGLFQAVYGLRDAGELAEHERTWFLEVVGWFERHLPSPKDVDLRAATSAKGERDRVVFWFKDDAVEHVQRMRQVALLLGHHGVATRLIRSARPGRIVYEDAFQVGAVPYRDTPR